MNKEQFTSIENRWLASSGGPWSTSDLRDRTQKFGVLFSTRRSVARMLVEGGKLDTIRLSTQKEAMEQGKMSAVQWVETLESMANDPDPLPHVVERCRMIVSMPLRQREAVEKEVDKRMMTRRPKVDDEPVPSFAIMPNAKQEDVSLVLHAAKDIGDLLHAVSRLTEQVDSLVEQLGESRQQRDDAASDAKLCRERVEKFRVAAEEVVRIGAT